MNSPLSNPFRNLPSYVRSSEPVRRISRAILLASLVGLLAGIAAFCFDLMVNAVTHHSLALLADYQPERPENAGRFFTSEAVPHVPEIPEQANLNHSSTQPESNTSTTVESTVQAQPKLPIWWLLILIPTAGGLACGFIVHWLCPEVAGPGTNSAINAYHRNRGIIRRRVPFLKAIASSLTIGTGGSGGSEGPIALIGAGVGSALGRIMKLTDAERRTLLIAGVGAGIGAVFHAPLAGAIFAVEVLYRDPDFESDALIPSFFSTVIAYTAYATLLFVGMGDVNAFEPLFELGNNVDFNANHALVLGIPLTALVVVVVVTSLVFTQLLRIAKVFFEKSPLPVFLKPAIGGLGTGCTALIIYLIMTHGKSPAHGLDSLAVLGTGYGFLQNIFHSPAQLSILLLAIVAIGKTFTTVFSIGSGGSGGVFGPSVVIGACLGALIGTIFAKYTNWVTENQIPIFVILGMASFFAAAANTPLSTLIMVNELTGKYELLLPSMWCCALAYVFGRGWTLFEAQVANRVDSPAHRGDFIIDLLDGFTVRDALTQTRHRIVTVPLGMTLHEVTDVATGAQQTTFPVLDHNESYYGVFGLQDIKQFLKNSGSEMGELAVAQDLAKTDVPTLSLSTTLDSAVEAFAKTNLTQLPVVDSLRPGELVGILSMQEIINIYNAQLMKQHKHLKTRDMLG